MKTYDLVVEPRTMTKSMMFSRDDTKSRMILEILHRETMIDAVSI